MHLHIIYVSFCLPSWKFSEVQTNPLIRVPKPGLSTEVFRTAWTCLSGNVHPQATPPPPALNEKGGVCVGWTCSAFHSTGRLCPCWSCEPTVPRPPTAVPGGTEVRAVTSAVAGESRTVAGNEGPRCHF